MRQPKFKLFHTILKQILTQISAFHFKKLDNFDLKNQFKPILNREEGSWTHAPKHVIKMQTGI